MDSIKPTSAHTKTKLAKTFQKIIHLKTATRALSNNGSSLLKPRHNFKNGDPKHENSQQFNKDESEEAMSRNRAAMEAFIAKLFATISVLKAAYAQLQMAQFPYNGDAIQCADNAVVHELKALSELKQSFLKKQINSSPPHVTLLLSQIEEQQSLMKMFEITRNKMGREIEAKESGISSLRNELNESNLNNRSLEKRLNSIGCSSVLNNVNLSDPNPNNFITVLGYALRSIRSFVKRLVCEMESANWDIDEAVNAIEPDVMFSNPNHRCFVFESFVCREMFNGFSDPNFSLPNEPLPDGDPHPCRFVYFERFEKLKSKNSIQFLKHSPKSTFGQFTRAKYLRLVHPKMEASFSGNLNQRKMVSVWEYPDTGFFGAFAEMARRVWLLHCLAFCFDEEVRFFEVRKNCRFSEVYMASVIDDVFLAADGDFRVAFTVVPGFKIGMTVIQSQVYPSPALSPAEC